MSDRLKANVPVVLMSSLGFFAGWTAGSVPLTLSGARFHFLWLALGTSILGAIVGAKSAPALWNLPRVPPASIRRPDRGEAVLWLIGAALFVLSAGYFVKSSDAFPLWTMAVILSAAALLSTRDTIVPATVEGGVGASITPSGLAALMLGIIALYILIHRPDADDAFYLNLPLGIQTSGAGMMVWDTMYGEEHWPLLGSNYRVEALPTLVAAISAITGLSIITVAHGVLPIIWCVLWALVLALIGRAFFGERWWIFACLSVLATLIFGGTLQTWGVHGVTRLFHGKAPLLLIIVPLIVYTVFVAHTSRIALRTAWTVLVVLETAALGLTANAIYIAPLTLGLALAAAFIGAPDVRRTLVLITPAFIPVFAGLWLISFDPPVAAGEGRNALDLSLWEMASHKITLAALLASILGAALTARFIPSARFITAFTFVSLIFAINPFLWSFFDRHVTGGLSFRIWWALPVPMLLAGGLTWALGLLPRSNIITAAAALGLIAMSLLSSGVIGMEDTTVNPSLHKLPPEADRAREIAKIAQDKRTLAPEAFAAWLPIWKDRPPIVFSRRLYLDLSRQVLPPEATEPRILLSDWIDGRTAPPARDVEQALRKLCVETLILHDSRSTIDGAAYLGSQGGTPIARIGEYVLLKVDSKC